MSVHALNLSKTPIWDYLSTYCNLKSAEPAAAYAWINSDQVPEQLKQQIIEMGDILVDANITP